MEFNLLVIVITLVLIFAVLFAKIFTSQILTRMRQRIANAQQDLNQAMGQFKSAVAKKNVAEKNRLALERKKAKLIKRARRKRQDVNSLEAEHEHRSQLRDTMRGKLMRN